MVAAGGAGVGFGADIGSGTGTGTAPTLALVTAVGIVLLIFCFVIAVAAADASTAFAPPLCCVCCLIPSALTPSFSPSFLSGTKVRGDIAALAQSPPLISLCVLPPPL